jgi:succinylarginine dihydrolase
MSAHELNFDGFVGRTPNDAGLSPGNIASMSHRGATSNPREAARFSKIRSPAQRPRSRLCHTSTSNN